MATSNPTRSLGAGSTAVFLNIVLAVAAAVGWYLFYEEQKQHVATTELLMISEEAAAQLAPAQDAARSLEGRVKRLEDDLGAANAELERLRSANASLDGLRTDLDRAETEILVRDRDLTAAKAAMDSLRSALERTAAEVDTRGSALTRLERARAEFEQDLGKERLLHRHTRDQLERTRAALADANGGQQAGDDGMRIAELEAELARVQRLAQMSPDELEQELERRLQQQASVDADASNLQAERQKLADELAREQAQRQELLGRIASISSDVEAKESALVDAQQDVRELNQELDLTRQRQDELRARLAEQEAEAKHFADLKDSLERELNESRVQITQLKNRMTVINMTSEVLFSSGSAQLKPAGRRVLSLIASSLNSYPNRAISVEGHTDNVPIGRNSPYSSNWELSAARAMSAVNFLQQESSVDPARLRVVGHGEYQPVASNDSAEGRQQNRRIEIRLLPAAESS